MRTTHPKTWARSALTLLLAMPLTSLAQAIDPDTAEGYVQVNRKIQCSLEDAKPMVYSWSGRTYARVPGERDRHLFNLLGMNIRQCGALDDPERGTGYRLVSREIMLYLDPQTNEVLNTWENPWTGETVEVIHVANDPVNGRPTFGRTAEGGVTPMRMMEINGTWMTNFEVPLFYTNVLGGDYQKYVGGTYHATEIFNFNGELDELLDPSKPEAYPVVSWVRLSQWLPWMEMNGRAGLLYFNAIGKKLEHFDQLDELMKSQIAQRYPDYVAPPPLNDKRRNETSWTYMKKIIDSREDKPAASGGH
jgi:hypothetical protein